MRKKSINLVLLIFIVLVIIALIILSIYLINHSDKSEEESVSSEENTSYVQLQLTDINSENNKTETIIRDTNSILNSLENFEDIENNKEEANTISENSTLALNNHVYTFDNSIEASIVQNSANKSELQINYLNYNFQIYFSTDSSLTFEDLKNSPSLKDYLESNYNISITSSLKSGDLGNINIIICTISDGKGLAYFVVTPLNDSEIAYAKIYNTDDSYTLIDDLSNPIDKISSIIADAK